MHPEVLIVICDCLIRHDDFAGGVDKSIDIELNIRSHTKPIVIHPVSAIRIDLPANIASRAVTQNL